MILHVLAIACFVVVLSPGGSAIPTTKTVPDDVKNILNKYNVTDLSKLINGTRRIIRGSPAERTMPYMVYLKLPSNSAKFQQYRRWLCGGVIVSDEYILTSAACIEDAKHFYVVSGTFKHREEDDRFNNMCIKNGAKKAIWKCIPRNYVFDGHENDNIRWMNNDIAVVRLEDEFDFNRRVRGCDFVPKPICYNNVSLDLERAGNVATIAGWGSTDYYNDWVNSRRQYLGQSQVEFNMDLLMTYVVLINKSRCKHRWGKRYENIIENYMICSKDTIAYMSELCSEKYVDCTDINYSASGEEDGRRMTFINPENLTLHSPYHNATRRTIENQGGSGGFCENDHGGPLVYGDGVQSVVIGIISACLVKDRTNKCYGPFLYTSVFKNRMLLDCAIYKQTLGDCKKAFRASETHDEYVLSWADHPDGPAKNEVAAARRQAELQSSLKNVTNLHPTDASSKVQGNLEHKLPSSKATEEKAKPENKKPAAKNAPQVAQKPGAIRLGRSEPQSPPNGKPETSKVSEVKSKVTQKPKASPDAKAAPASRKVVENKTTKEEAQSAKVTGNKGQSNLSKKPGSNKNPESSKSKTQPVPGPTTKSAVKPS